MIIRKVLETHNTIKLFIFYIQKDDTIDHNYIQLKLHEKDVFLLNYYRKEK